MDELIFMSASTCCFVSLVFGALMLARKSHLPIVSKVLSPSASSTAATPGKPLPVPPNQKRTAPWNIAGINNPQNAEFRKDLFRIKYVGGKWGNESGAGFHANPFNALPATSCTFSFSVYFAQNFNFKKGGKLPGLCFGTAEDDCATGGEWSGQGGSFRTIMREDGVAVANLYLALGEKNAAFDKQSKEYASAAEISGGGHLLWRKEASLRFKKGAWNPVSMRLVLNTPGASDGMASLTVNGVTKTMRGVMFRKLAATKITSVSVASFFGGGSSDWAAPGGQWADFKDFKFAAP
jgi:hypothetical protein